jgi:hypothetical protein
VFPRLRLIVCLFVCLVPGSQSSIAVAHDEIAVTGSVRKRVGFFQKRIWCSRHLRRRGGGIGGERVGEREGAREEGYGGGRC